MGNIIGSASSNRSARNSGTTKQADKKLTNTKQVAERTVDSNIKQVGQKLTNHATLWTTLMVL